MKNNATQQSGIFFPGQTFIIGSESYAPLPNDLGHLDVTETADLITQILEFKYFKASINSLENDSN